jgi:hypothetical protein
MAAFNKVIETYLHEITNELRHSRMGLGRNVNNDMLHSLMTNENMTFDFIKAHPEVKWDWDFMGGMPYITQDILKQWKTDQTLAFNWYIVSRKNPNLTWQFINDTPELRWDIFSLLENPCLRIKDSPII